MFVNILFRVWVCIVISDTDLQLFFYMKTLLHFGVMTVLSHKMIWEVFPLVLLIYIKFVLCRNSTVTV